jgi:hypothetical protein
LFDYAFYVYWRQFDLLLLSLASKLGCHPCTKAVLIAISAIPQNKPPLGQYQLKMADMGYILVELCFLYVLETGWTAFA